MALPVIGRIGENDMSRRQVSTSSRVSSLAIIPARGGSKRIPRKNIKSFQGKPMIAYAIAAAKRSGLFEHIVVSTDDDEVAAVARAWGAETPFARPEELANDFVATAPVVAHALQECDQLSWRCEYACCIYPAVPLLREADLQASLSLMLDSGADYCFPIAEFPAAIQRAFARSATGRLKPLYPEFELTRTQDLEPAYYDAGQFYWGTSRAWLSNPNIHSSGVGYPIPSWRAVDIDTSEDWEHAERLYKNLCDEAGCDSSD